MEVSLLPIGFCRHNYMAVFLMKYLIAGNVLVDEKSLSSA